MKTESELKSIIEDELSSAIGVDGSEVSVNRTEALKYYKGDKRGDELEGRSQVISTDVADAIEWIMPQITETFFSSEEILRFDPVDENDEDQAEQESDYVSYVVMKENDAFLNLSTWFRDALLMRNGYMKVFWEDEEEKREEYFDLDITEFNAIMADRHYRVEEYAERMAEDGMTILIDAVVYRTTAPGKVTYMAIPPEHVFVNSDHRSIKLDDARFVAHEELRPASDLIADGFDPEIVDTLPPHNYEGDETTYTRELHSEEYGDDAGDYSMRLVTVYECYIMVDMDGDGIAERHKVVYAGNQILDSERFDGMPIVSLTGILYGHQHLGLSLYDRLKQVQDQKTAIWRQLLDNLYLQNNQRTIVRSGHVNMQDLLTSRPGGIVRLKKDAPGDSVTPFPVAPMGRESFTMLEYLDKTREERSGVGPDTMGQSMSLSNDTAHGIERLMSAKEMLVGLMTRTLAEVGVKPLFLKVRELLMTHQDKPKVVKLRGKWVPILPTEWRDRMNTTLKVGLGTGDRLKQLSTMQQILQIQEKLMAGGGMGQLVTPKKIHNALEDMVKFGGLPSADPYFLDPDSDEAKQMQMMAQQNQKPDPQQQLLMLEAEDRKQKNQLKMQELQLKEKELEFTGQLKQRELDFKGKEADQDNMREIAIKERELDLKEKEFYYTTQAPIDAELEKANSANQLAEIITNLAQQLSAPRVVQRDENGEIIGIGFGE